MEQAEEREGDSENGDNDSILSSARKAQPAAPALKLLGGLNNTLKTLKQDSYHFSPRGSTSYGFSSP